jgi:hypothetical protein
VEHGATKGDFAGDLVLGFAKQQLARADQELLQIQSDLRKARLELEAAKAHEKGVSNGAPAKAGPATMRNALQDRIALLESTARLLQEEQERRRSEVVRQAVRGAQLGAQLDDVREDLGQIEELIKRVQNQELALDVQLNAPKREQLLEPAVIMHPSASTAGRTAAVALAGLLCGLFVLACLSLRVSLR